MLDHPSIHHPNRAAAARHHDPDTSMWGDRRSTQFINGARDCRQTQPAQTNQQTEKPTPTEVEVGFLPVELRGFEPLTPTLPGAGRVRDQAR